MVHGRTVVDVEVEGYCSRLHATDPWMYDLLIVQANMHSHMQCASHSDPS